MTIVGTVRPTAGPAAGEAPSRSRQGRLRLARPAAGRVEPWRDWAVLAVVNNGVLLVVALTRPAWPWLLLAGLPLGLGLATATLTVLHDAGHRRFSRRAWPNVLAVQTAAPLGLWVAHWTLKHRVHHRVTQLYPVDESTRSSSMVRLHPSAPWRPVHRFQHLYTWPLYGLAWAGELRSQLTYLRTGVVTGSDTPGAGRRLASFTVEKALCLVVLAPYIWLLGVGRLALLLLTAMTVGSVLAALVLVVGHINIGLDPPSSAPQPGEWLTHLVRTTASFSTTSPTARWLTGGMTHHLAHHLRPVAPRRDLPGLHATTVAAAVAASGAPQVEYPTLVSAVRGHWRRLKELGLPAPQPAGQEPAAGLEPAAAGVPVQAQARGREVARR